MLLSTSEIFPEPFVLPVKVTALDVEVYVNVAPATELVFVRLIDAPEQIADVKGVMDAVGVSLITTNAVSEDDAQPAMLMVLVTMYVPALEAAGSISPVTEFTVNPAVAVTVPALAPAPNTGETGPVTVVQYGPVYENVASGADVNVTDIDAVSGQAPLVM